jgi:hypothetical protein
MRGWGSSFCLAVVGALLLWIGIAQFEGAYVPSTGDVAGPVVRVASVDGRAAIMFAEEGPRFVLPASLLPHPTLQALGDATSVKVIYDARDYGRAAHAIVGLSVDGHDYYGPASYQAASALLALIVLVPGALMFGLGFAALKRPATDREVASEEIAAGFAHQALVIPFPRRAPVEVR